MLSYRIQYRRLATLGMGYPHAQLPRITCLDEARPLTHQEASEKSLSGGLQWDDYDLVLSISLIGPHRPVCRACRNVSIPPSSLSCYSPSPSKFSYTVVLGRRRVADMSPRTCALSLEPSLLPRTEQCTL